MEVSSAGEGSESAPLFVAIMRELGWVEGRNVVYDRVFVEGGEARLTAFGAELVARKPDLVYVTTPQAVRAILKTTRTIPIVFGAVNDPVAAGLIKNLARPGGNITGIANIGPELGGKRMQLLREVMPKVSRVGVLVVSVATGVTRGTALDAKLIEEAAGGSVRVISATAKDATQIDAALASLAESRVQAVLTTHHGLFRRESKRIVALASRQRIPVVGHRSDMANDGALMSYSSIFSEQIRRSAHLVDKVLRGTKPADIPVEQPTKFELVVNMKTAKALGITIPQSILLQATRVIE
jgi:putative ABC transport system substrate-binding protein